MGIAGGKIIKVEAHPIPEHYRPRRVQGRLALVGDAAGYVTKCSGEGIYFRRSQDAWLLRQSWSLWREASVSQPRRRLRGHTLRTMTSCMDRPTQSWTSCKKYFTQIMGHARRSWNYATPNMCNRSHLTLTYTRRSRATTQLMTLSSWERQLGV